MDKLIPLFFVVALGLLAFNATVQAQLDHILELNVPEQVKLDIEPEMHEYVLQQAEEAGLDRYEVWALINCESNWNDTIVSKLNSNGTRDYGLWQISLPTHSNTISYKDALDYRKATTWAINKRLNDGNWSAWMCSKIVGI